MDPLQWLILAVAALAGVGSWRLRFADRRRARRELRARPELDASLPDGTVVRISGVVRALETMTAPLSGRTCVVYRARVDDSGSWIRWTLSRSPMESAEVLPFLIDREGEATVLVDSSHAVLDLAPAQLGGGDRLRNEEFLRGLGLPVEHVAHARFEETLVEPGQAITVAGLMMMDDAPPPTEEQNFRDAPPPSLRLTGNRDHPLAIGRAPRSKPKLKLNAGSST